MSPSKVILWSITLLGSEVKFTGTGTGTGLTHPRTVEENLQSELQLRRGQAVECTESILHKGNPLVLHQPAQ